MRWVILLSSVLVLSGCVTEGDDAPTLTTAGAQPQIEADPADESTCPRLDSRKILDVGDHIGLGGPRLEVAGVWEAPQPRFTGEVTVTRDLHGALQLTAEGFSATLEPANAPAVSRLLPDGSTAWLDVIDEAHHFGGGETAWVLRDLAGQLLAASVFTDRTRDLTLGENARLILGEAVELEVEVLDRTCDPLPAYCFPYTLAHEVRVRLGEAAVALFSGERELEALGFLYTVRVNEASSGMDEDHIGSVCSDGPSAALQMFVYRSEPDT